MKLEYSCNEANAWFYIMLFQHIKELNLTIFVYNRNNEFIITTILNLLVSIRHSNKYTI